MKNEFKECKDNLPRAPCIASPVSLQLTAYANGE